MLPLLLLGGNHPAPAPRPALAVLIVLDGLPGGLLERYDSLFTGGFRRMHDEGFSFSSAMVDHAITVSHAGHVTIATGRFPAHHGIVDAAWYTLEPGGTRKFRDALVDSAEHVVGDSAGRTSVSPRQVLTDGIAEWAGKASAESRVAAIGTGPYSSLLHVFHPGVPVFWYDGGAGRYVTSS
ncbi:MAG: alkaline phosphatase family protein, partial [Gemmatimonadota bacterium]